MNVSRPATQPNAPVISLDSVRRGRIDRPLRILGHGTAGVGKSTFASGAPSPIFLGADEGTSELDIARLPEPKTWDEVIASLRALGREAHEYKTIVVDPVNWLEPLCWQHVCAAAGVADIEAFGYGKGYTAAVDQWRIFLNELERLWSGKGMHIILLAHSVVRPFRNPEGEDFDRYVISMHEKSAGLLTQWVDNVLFMRHEAFAKKTGKNARARGVSTGARFIHTQWHAAFEAKNRHNLPEQIPLEWESFWSAVQANRNGIDKAGDLKKQIAVAMKDIDDEAFAKNVNDWLAKFGERASASRLAELLNKINAKIGEKQ